jgi:hypothetical protein
MKKVIFIFSIFLLLTSCSYKSQQFASRPETSEVTGISFKKYSDLGFLITPDKYTEAYSSVGIIEVTTIPSAYQAMDTTIVTDNGSVHKVLYLKWVVGKVDINTALDKMYEYCVSNGADALVQFSTEYSTYIYEGFPVVPNKMFINSDGRNVKLPSVSVRGFAIKRIK